jgi:peptidyl-prolyl cis-trans isomerase C
MADQLKEEMAREAVTAQLDQLRSGAKIEKFAMDGAKPDAPAAKPAATPNRPATPPAAAPAPQK